MVDNAVGDKSASVKDSAGKKKGLDVNDFKVNRDIANTGSAGKKKEEGSAGKKKGSIFKRGRGRKKQGRDPAKKKKEEAKK